MCSQGGMHGKGAMHAGEMATEVGDTHPTGMHSCFVNATAIKKMVVLMSMRLFIRGGCDAFLCVMSHMEWVPYPFCVIVMCDSNMYLYRSQSHHVNKQP